MKKQFLLLNILFFIGGGIAVAQTSSLWGMASTGGSNPAGYIFKMNLDGTGFSKVYTFSPEDSPIGRLVKSADNKLYGITNRSDGGGTLFNFNPVNNTFSIGHVFSAVEGLPTGGLLLASDGKFYGMTTGRSSNGRPVSGSVDGILFRYNPANNTYAKLFSFSRTISGSMPFGSLMQASNGLLYGTTRAGGNDDYGVLFNFNIQNFTFNKLLNFSNSLFDPHALMGGLVEDGTRIFGLASQGGSGARGVLLGFQNGGSGYSLTHFLAANGKYPQGSILKYGPDNFFGLTINGGLYDKGVLYAYGGVNYNLPTRISFDGNNGANPDGSLIKGSNGKLYGLTRYGGAYNFGVAFSYDPQQNKLEKIHDFGSSGRPVPYGNLVEISGPATPGLINVTGGSSSVCPGNTRTFSISPVAGSNYSWKTPTGAIIKSGQGTSSITVAFSSAFPVSGTLSVKAYNVFGTSQSRNLTILRENNCAIIIAGVTKIISAVGTSPETEISATSMDLQVYPNPVQSGKSLTVKFSSEKSSQYMLTIFDGTGKIVLTQKVQSVKGANIFIQNPGNLQKGIYLLSLKGSGINLVHKLVVI